MLSINSFTELLQHSASKYQDNDAFRVRSGKHYKSISYNTLKSDAFNIAAHLTNQGLSNAKIALLGENSYHWVISYLGVVISNNVVVPIDKELSPTEIKNILTVAQVQMLFCSEDYLDTICEAQIETPVVVINHSEPTTQLTIQETIANGENLRKTNPTYGQNENAPQTVSTIVFTSGTTGFSKGVMLTRSNILSDVLNTNAFTTLYGSTLSLLPMNHTYEFTLDILLTIYQGVTICINNGIKNFQQNLQIFQPVNLVIVPLIAENLMKSVWMKIENENKLDKVAKAVKISRLLLKIGIDVRRKLFAPIHQAMGGKLQCLFIGGALLDPKIAQQFYDFGFHVSIGYGITECSPFVSGNITGKPKFFTSCGKTIPNVTVRINNPNENGEGEIQVKGPTVMLGYYQNPDATQEVMHDGWFSTGDIGRLDPHGMLYITGRMKNLIVLNNGKNVYPEELESLITNAQPLVKEVIVSAGGVGQNMEVNIAAEVFPDPETHLDLQTVRESITSSIEHLNEDLPYFKRIIEIKFRDSEFPKTTTKKIKRY